MSQEKKGRKQALKDISKEFPVQIKQGGGKVEVLSVTASHLDTKKTRHLNKELGL